MNNSFIASYLVKFSSESLWRPFGVSGQNILANIAMLSSAIYVSALTEGACNADIKIVLQKKIKSPTLSVGVERRYYGTIADE